MSLVLGMSQYGLGREQVALSSRVIARRPFPPVAAGQYLAMAVAQAQRGAWDSSLVAIDGYITRSADPNATAYAYRMAVVGAWLGALAPDVASARRAGAMRDSANLAPASRAELAWLDGLLAVASRDATALAAARRALRGADTTTAPMLERSLAAFASALDGDRDRRCRLAGSAGAGPRGAWTLALSQRCASVSHGSEPARGRPVAPRAWPTGRRSAAALVARGRWSSPSA